MTLSGIQADSGGLEVLAKRFYEIDAQTPGDGIPVTSLIRNEFKAAVLFSQGTLIKHVNQFLERSGFDNPAQYTMDNLLTPEEFAAMLSKRGNDYLAEGTVATSKISPHHENSAKAFLRELGLGNDEQQIRGLAALSYAQEQNIPNRAMDVMKSFLLKTTFNKASGAVIPLTPENDPQIRPLHNPTVETLQIA